MIEVLKSFGFTEYEAKVIATLLAKGVLTAREIAEISGIPRTSVYDVMASLKAKGFVEEIGKPAKFRTISTEEMISILTRKAKENLDLLREEFSKLRSDEEIEVVKLYRGKAVLEKLEELVNSSREEIVVLISYLKPEIREILSRTKCRLIVISSNVSNLKGEIYEINELITKNRNAEFAYGLIIFDSNKIFAIFVDHTMIGIVGEGEGVVQFSKLMVEPLMRELRKKKE
ncbi:MAG: helix-turn-helix domain-containing protein [Archaeoglobaceae archaeon]|nr:helix-turn-helix domain-containing protein [Archaeoglobaceae archaeon]MDW7989093.1 helix-turn-helix domain-containing protein [Archaeoglobaceae archaeon]